MQREVAAADVQAAHQQIGRARGLGQIDYLTDIVGVGVGAEQEQRTLRQAASRLVHGHRAHVRPRLHGADGQLVVEIEMGAVRLVG